MGSSAQCLGGVFQSRFPTKMAIGIVFVFFQKGMVKGHPLFSVLFCKERTVAANGFPFPGQGPSSFPKRGHSCLEFTINSGSVSELTDGSWRILTEHHKNFLGETVSFPQNFIDI